MSTIEGTSLIWRIKAFFGRFVLTPFEEALITELRNALKPEYKKVLDSQLRAYNKISRFLNCVDDPKSYGFTEFHRVKFGKPVLNFGFVFTQNENEEKLATAKVVFREGEIDVDFWLVNGRLFSIEYRSPQKIYYPPSEYEIKDLSILIKNQESMGSDSID